MDVRAARRAAAAGLLAADARRPPVPALLVDPIRGQGDAHASDRAAAPATVLRYVALVLFITALARPQMGYERIRDFSRGIAIEMVVDRSSSMGAEMRFMGPALQSTRSRQEGLFGFRRRRRRAAGRPNDLVGMITFARYPDTICPLTLSHATLRMLIENVKLVQDRPEDGTAIGDAVALAAARLRTAEERWLGRPAAPPTTRSRARSSSC